MLEPVVDTISHKCNKYIICEGEFIRDFNRMYKEIPDPWNQKSYVSADIMSRISMFLLSLIAPSQWKETERTEILDIGTGPGHLTPWLLELFQEKAYSYIGTDISEEAIIQALTLDYPNSLFMVDDIREENSLFINRFDLIYCAKTLYYVAPEINSAIKNILLYGKTNSLFCFTYNLAKDSFSRRFLELPDLRKIISCGYEELYFVEINRDQKESLNIGIYRKK